MTSNAVTQTYRRTLAKVGQQATFVRVTGFAPNPVTTQQATVNIMASGDIPDVGVMARTGYNAKNEDVAEQVLDVVRRPWTACGPPRK
jgi:hypothetical protein